MVLLAGTLLQCRRPVSSDANHQRHCPGMPGKNAAPRQFRPASKAQTVQSVLRPEFSPHERVERQAYSRMFAGGLVDAVCEIRRKKEQVAGTHTNAYAGGIVGVQLIVRRQYLPLRCAVSIETNAIHLLFCGDVEYAADKTVGMRMPVVRFPRFRKVKPRLRDVELMIWVGGDYLPSILVNMLFNKRSYPLHFRSIENTRVDASQVGDIPVQSRLHLREESVLGLCKFPAIIRPH
jgi:hypothetical protein